MGVLYAMPFKTFRHSVMFARGITIVMRDIMHLTVKYFFDAKKLDLNENRIFLMHFLIASINTTPIPDHFVSGSKRIFLFLHRKKFRVYAAL